MGFGSELFASDLFVMPPFWVIAAILFMGLPMDVAPEDIIAGFRGTILVLLRHGGVKLKGHHLPWIEANSGGSAWKVSTDSLPNNWRPGRSLDARSRPSGAVRWSWRPDGVCVATFDVGHTLVPKQVVKGSKDDRALGAHFLRFDYKP